MSIHKFSVPDKDQIVEKWIASQSNLGMSVRMLINLFVTEHGYQDVTCMAMGLAAKRRGRPSKNLKQKYEETTQALYQGNGYPVYDENEDETGYPQEQESAYEEAAPPDVQERSSVQNRAVPADRTQSQQTGSVPKQAVSVQKQMQEPMPVKKPFAPPPAEDDMLNMFSAPPVGNIGSELDDMLDDDGFVDPDDLLG